MKKIIFLLSLVVMSLAAFSQDSTVATMTDSDRMYAYKNVYVVITRVNVIPPGSVAGLRSITSDSAKWVTTISISVYTSKADFKAGKPELFSSVAPTLVTDKFPTQREILDRMRLIIK